MFALIFIGDPKVLFSKICLFCTLRVVAFPNSTSLSAFLLYSQFLLVFEISRLIFTVNLLLCLLIFSPTLSHTVDLHFKLSGSSCI